MLDALLLLDSTELVFEMLPWRCFEVVLNKGGGMSTLAGSWYVGYAANSEGTGILEGGDGRGGSLNSSGGLKVIISSVMSATFTDTFFMIGLGATGGGRVVLILPPSARETGILSTN